MERSSLRRLEVESKLLALVTVGSHRRHGLHHRTRGLHRHGTGGLHRHGTGGLHYLTLVRHHNTS
jgi:hypothetical protein